jgi:antitoxin component HigA of HigAB toxin-antitoxin module
MNRRIEVLASGQSSFRQPGTRQVNWLNEHLPDPADQRAYARQKCAEAISSTIERAMSAANLNRAGLAQKLGKSKPSISRMLRGAHNMTLFTLGDLLWACNLEVENFDSALAPLGVVNVAADDAEEWNSLPVYRAAPLMYAQSGQPIPVRVAS